MFNEYTPLHDVLYGDPPPPPSRFVTPTAGGGGSSTPTTSSGAKANERTSRQNDILALSESQLQVALKIGLLSPAEVDAVKGAGYSARLADDPWGKAENDIVAQWQKSPPAFFRSTLDSSENPALAMKGLSSVSGEPYGQGPAVSGAGGYTGASSSSRASGAGGGGAGSSSPASATAAPALAGTYNANNGRPYLEYQGQRYMLPQGATADDPRTLALQQRLAAGNTSGSVIGNTKADLYLRGGTDLGKATILNGTQYRASGVQPVEGPDGKWYIPGQQTPFASEAAAKAAIPLVSYGAGLTSRFGNSPAAKAAASGGYAQTVDNPLFNLIPLDQSIAAGATKGMQPGEILTTLNRKGYQPLDVTTGGIESGGGLTLATPGDYEMRNGFTGQLPGNVSIGMSSINNAGQGAYWLAQTLGVPMTEISKLGNLTPSQIAQIDQAAQTLRQNGGLPNFAKLYAENEPSGYQGAAGGPELKWGSANGGANNTPYDQAWNQFIDYALKQGPDLEYLPDVTVAPGQSGGKQPDYWWLDDPSLMAKGGQVMTHGPLAMVDMMTGHPVAIAGEAGPEKITVTPTGRDITMGREGMGLMGKKPRMMAGGGSIKTQPYYGDLNAYNEMKNDNVDGGLVIPQTGINVNNGWSAAPPFASANGQMVQAQWSDLSPETQASAISKYGAPGYTTIGTSPIGYQSVGGTQANRTIPIYSGQAQDPETQAYLERMRGYAAAGNLDSSIAPQRKLVLTNVGGVPTYVETWEMPAGRRGMPSTQEILSRLNGGGSGGAGGGGAGGGMGGGGMWGPMGYANRDWQIEAEAARRRQYDIQARNYARAGLPSPTMLNLDTGYQNGMGGQGQSGGNNAGYGITTSAWNGPGPRPGSTKEKMLLAMLYKQDPRAYTDYQIQHAMQQQNGGGMGGPGTGMGGDPNRQPPDYYPYSRPVHNGFTLPFDYFPNQSPWENWDGNDMPWRNWWGNWGGNGGQGGQPGTGSGQPPAGGGQPWQDWFGQMPWGNWTPDAWQQWRDQMPDWSGGNGLPWWRQGSWWQNMGRRRFMPMGQPLGQGLAA